MNYYRPIFQPFSFIQSGSNNWLQYFNFTIFAHLFLSLLISKITYFWNISFFQFSKLLNSWLAVVSGAQFESPPGSDGFWPLSCVVDFGCGGFTRGFWRSKRIDIEQRRSCSNEPMSEQRWASSSSRAPEPDSSSKTISKRKKAILTRGKIVETILEEKIKMWNCVEDRVGSDKYGGRVIRRIIFDDIYADRIAVLSQNPISRAAYPHLKVP